MKEETIKPTRTLLLTNIPLSTLHTLTPINTIKETYTIQDNPNILFVIFYDIRTATQTHDTLNQAGHSAAYTVSKYEIPREGDRCDESKNQSTLLVVGRDLVTPLGEQEICDMFGIYGDIKAVREYKAYQKFVEFYDSRSAVDAYNGVNEKDYKEGKIVVRFVWDNSARARWEMIHATDKVLESSGKEKSVKRRKISKKNVFVESFDDFIGEQIDALRGCI